MAVADLTADLALVLAIDGSASVGYDEFNLIANGIAGALRDPDVVAGLIGGAGSLCAVLLWSGAFGQAVMVDWTPVGSAADADALADQVRDMPRIVRPGATAIGAALLAADALLGRVAAVRRIVDVAGDGRSNEGPGPGNIRDRMVAAGIVINGLCVLHEEADLLERYQREVIGGPGSFALACADFAGFATAMRQKLVREVA